MCCGCFCGKFRPLLYIIAILSLIQGIIHLIITIYAHEAVFCRWQPHSDSLAETFTYMLFFYRKECLRLNFPSYVLSHNAPNLIMMTEGYRDYGETDEIIYSTTISTSKKLSAEITTEPFQPSQWVNVTVDLDENSSRIDNVDNNNRGNENISSTSSKAPQFLYVTIPLDGNFEKLRLLLRNLYSEHPELTIFEKTTTKFETSKLKDDYGPKQRESTTEPYLLVTPEETSPNTRPRSANTKTFETTTTLKSTTPRRRTPKTTEKSSSTELDINRVSDAMKLRQFVDISIDKRKRNQRKNKLTKARNRKRKKNRTTKIFRNVIKTGHTNITQGTTQKLTLATIIKLSENYSQVTTQRLNVETNKKITENYSKKLFDKSKNITMVPSATTKKFLKKEIIKRIRRGRKKLLSEKDITVSDFGNETTTNIRIKRSDNTQSLKFLPYRRITAGYSKKTIDKRSSSFVQLPTATERIYLKKERTMPTVPNETKNVFLKKEYTTMRAKSTNLIEGTTLPYILVKYDDPDEAKTSRARSSINRKKRSADGKSNDKVFKKYPLDEISPITSYKERTNSSFPQKGVSALPLADQRSNFSVLQNKLFKAALFKHRSGYLDSQEVPFLDISYSKVSSLTVTNLNISNTKIQRKKSNSIVLQDLSSTNSSYTKVPSIKNSDESNNSLGLKQISNVGLLGEKSAIFRKQTSVKEDRIYTSGKSKQSENTIDYKNKTLSKVSVPINKTKNQKYSMVKNKRSFDVKKKSLPKVFAGLKKTYSITRHTFTRATCSTTQIPSSSTTVETSGPTTSKPSTSETGSTTLKSLGITTGLKELRLIKRLLPETTKKQNVSMNETEILMESLIVEQREAIYTPKYFPKLQQNIFNDNTKTLILTETLDSTRFFSKKKYSSKIRDPPKFITNYSQKSISTISSPINVFPFSARHKTTVFSKQKSEVSKVPKIRVSSVMHPKNERNVEKIFNTKGYGLTTNNRKICGRYEMPENVARPKLQVPKIDIREWPRSHKNKEMSYSTTKHSMTENRPVHGYYSFPYSFYLPNLIITHPSLYLEKSKHDILEKLKNNSFKKENSNFPEKKVYNVELVTTKAYDFMSLPFYQYPFNTANSIAFNSWKSYLKNIQQKRSKRSIAHGLQRDIELETSVLQNNAYLEDQGPSMYIADSDNELKSKDLIFPDPGPIVFESDPEAEFHINRSLRYPQPRKLPGDLTYSVSYEVITWPYRAKALKQMYKFIIGYLVLDSCWIFSSLLLILAACVKVRGLKSYFLYVPWILTTLAMCIMDVITTAWMIVKIVNTRTWMGFLNTMGVHNLTIIGDTTKYAFPTYEGSFKQPAVWAFLFCIRLFIFFVWNLITLVLIYKVFRIVLHQHSCIKKIICYPDCNDPCRTVCIEAIAQPMPNRCRSPPRQNFECRPRGQFCCHI